MQDRSATLRERHRRTVVRAAVGLTLGLVALAGGVLLAALARHDWCWLPLAVGTLSFGAGLALLPRARRMRFELARAEELARTRHHELRARRVAMLVSPR